MLPAATASSDVVHHVRAERVVLATGAHERPIAFAGNDRPGVMLASAARAFLDRFGVLVGERIVVFSTNHAGHEAAEALADCRRAGRGRRPFNRRGRDRAAARRRCRGADRRQRRRDDGDPALVGVTIASARRLEDTIEADVLAVSGGWNPTVQLARGIGIGLAYDDDKACFVHDGTGPDVARGRGRRGRRRAGLVPAVGGGRGG